MRIRDGYLLRQVIDIHVVLGIGNDTYVPNEIMSLNEAGAFLWRILEKGAEKEDLVKYLVAEYEIDTITAENDVDRFLNQLREKALITE